MTLHLCSLFHTSDVIKTFLKTRIKTTTLISRIRPRPSLVFRTKTKTLHLKTKTKTKTFLWRILEADRKTFFIFGRIRICRRKLNSIYGRKRNEIENVHSFWAEKWKRMSPDNITFFSFSYIQSPTRHRQYVVQFRLFACGPCWRDFIFLM